jgi:hypothetical protein
MERLKRRAKVAAAALSAAAILALVPAGSAMGAISPASCTNGGGNTPPGQQPVCSGAGLDQNPATNPAGHAPPGQQP